MKFSRKGYSFISAGLAVVLGLVLATSAMAEMSKDDQKFVREAASGGMMEVKLGEVAMNQATNPAVKEFAQRMVNEHSKANAELMSLAKSKSVDVPKEMNQDHRSMYEHLSQLKGAEFDREYMRHMIEDHVKDVSEFKEAAKDGQDPDIKSFAADKTPKLEEHLKMAKDIHGKVERG